ncbi:MAG: hypothetical protein MJD61_07750 [Proteobacteria bacterium]|nr:hypothetical protein [Pseudomonadota bacterium]
MMELGLALTDSDAALALGVSGRRRSFYFGGVRFDVRVRGLQWDVPPAVQSYITACSDALPVAGRIACALEAGPGPTLEGDADVACEWHGDRARVRTRGLHAMLRRCDRGDYAARALVPSAHEGIRALTSALSATVVEREGGIRLHAVPLQLGEKVVLLMGPSGAGKSTSADQCAGARVLSYDHAALVRCRSRWFAWGVPGGAPAHSPVSSSRALAVAGILRVRKASCSPARIVPLHLVHATLAVRENAKSGTGASGEARFLAACAEISRALPVAELWTVLGAPLRDVIEEWMNNA